MNDGLCVRLLRWRENLAVNPGPVALVPAFLPADNARHQAAPDESATPSILISAAPQVYVLAA